MLIFKAQNTDYREKLYKRLLIITAAALLAVYLSGVYLNNKEASINREIENNIKQLKKYSYLHAQSRRTDSSFPRYQILNKTVNYSEKIELENLYLDRKEIIIYARTDRENNIFVFLNRLKNDNLFLNSEIIEIKKDDKLNFKIRAELIKD